MSKNLNKNELQTNKLWKWSGWGKVLGGFGFILIVLLILSPEIAMFSFLLDAAVIETLILLIGIQLQSYLAIAWSYFLSIVSVITRRIAVLIRK